MDYSPNDRRDGERRTLRFGELDSDEIGLDKAEQFLRWVREHAPGTWASGMLAVYAPGYHATRDRKGGAA